MAPPRRSCRRGEARDRAARRDRRAHRRARRDRRVLQHDARRTLRTSVPPTVRSRRCWTAAVGIANAATRSSTSSRIARATSSGSVDWPSSATSANGAVEAPARPEAASCRRRSRDRSRRGARPGRVADARRDAKGRSVTPPASRRRGAGRGRDSARPAPVSPTASSTRWIPRARDLPSSVISRGAGRHASVSAHGDAQRAPRRTRWRLREQRLQGGGDRVQRRRRERRSRPTGRVAGSAAHACSRAPSKARGVPVRRESASPIARTSAPAVPAGRSRSPPPARRARTAAPASPRPARAGRALEDPGRARGRIRVRAQEHVHSAVERDVHRAAAGARPGESQRHLDGGGRRGAGRGVRPKLPAAITRPGAEAIGARTRPCPRRAPA